METATALLVMMIGGLGICAVFAYAIKNNTGSRDRAAAIAVAQQEMERYRQVTFLDPLLTARSRNHENGDERGSHLPGDHDNHRHDHLAENNHDRSDSAFEQRSLGAGISQYQRATFGICFRRLQRRSVNRLNQ